PDLVEACVRTDRMEAATEASAAIEELAQPAAPAWTLALAARCGSLLADGDAAEDECLNAIRLLGERRPFDVARTSLLLGERLRRNRSPLEARDHLRSALEKFDRLGAAPWADLARAELRATGETTPAARDPSAAAQLTPQELQVAEFASQGLSNKEIGAQLFLSPRTVEYHLRKVYVKLGIASRTELIRLDREEVRVEPQVRQLAFGRSTDDLIDAAELAVELEHPDRPGLEIGSREREQRVDPRGTPRRSPITPWNGAQGSRGLRLP